MPQIGPQPLTKSRTVQALPPAGPYKGASYKPIVTDVQASVRPGWLDVYVNLAPGLTVTGQITTGNYASGGLPLLVDALHRLYLPVGASTDLYTQE